MAYLRTWTPGSSFLPLAESCSGVLAYLIPGSSFLPLVGSCSGVLAYLISGSSFLPLEESCSGVLAHLNTRLIVPATCGKLRHHASAVVPEVSHAIGSSVLIYSMQECVQLMRVSVANFVSNWNWTRRLGGRCDKISLRVFFVIVGLGVRVCPVRSGC